MGGDAQGMVTMLGARIPVTDVIRTESSCKRLPSIPFFLSMESCPRRCVYCHQGEITGVFGTPSPRSVRETLVLLREPREICFFGGSFTCFPEERRKDYLDAVLTAPGGSLVRFSTHPQCITHAILDSLSPYPVSMIELGISSLDDGVLKACNRGYTGEFALSAMTSVLESGFQLGAQMMIGLPGQTEDSSVEDLHKIAAIRGRRERSSVTLRIYPCLVLEKTPLAELMNRGVYSPLTLEEGVRRAGRLLFEAERLGFPVQRVGLHATESLSRSVLAGPHHPALGEMARAVAFVTWLLKSSPYGPWEIDRRHISLLRGHCKFGLRFMAETTGLPLSDIETRILYAAF